MANANGCERRGCCGGCDGAGIVVVNIVWVQLLLGGVPVVFDAGAGHFLPIDTVAGGGTFSATLTGFQLEDGATVELDPLPPPFSPPNFSASISGVAITEDVGSQPGLITFDLSVIDPGAAFEGSYGIVYVSPSGQRTVIGSIAAPEGGCPTITSISPDPIPAGAVTAVTITGTGLDQPGTWSAEGPTVAGPGPLPLLPDTPPTPTSVSWFVDATAALPGNATVTFTPDDPACSPVNITLRLTSA